MSDLAGKVALVTGGGTGIGRGIARGFGREGMKLALAGLEHAPSADNQYESRRLGGCSAATVAAGPGRSRFESPQWMIPCARSTDGSPRPLPYSPASGTPSTMCRWMALAQSTMNSSKVLESLLTTPGK